MNDRIEMLKVSKKYPQAADLAVDNISLTIPQGQFVGIAGMNGSGKTTLARLLNGLLLPSSGQVLVNGLNTAEAGNRQEIKRLVGMVFQNPDNQIINPIVEEEVAFGVENLNLPAGEVDCRVDWALETVGLTALRGHAPHLLSGGQKQRLALAAALAMKPACLVLDEPTSMLDQPGRLELMQCLHRLNREEQITVVMISHRMEEVAGADRLIVLHQGAVHLDGPPWEIFGSSRFTSLGMQPPPISGLVSRLLSQGYRVDKKIVTLEQMVKFLCP